MNEVTLRELTPALWLVERPLDAEMGVCAAIVFGGICSVVVDTLICPEDMAPVRDLLAERGLPVIVINTHADWDHTWGNSAFPDVPIIAHRLCRAAMLTEGVATLAQKRVEEPDRFGNVVIVPPTVTFSEFMDIDLGGLTLSMHALPGHTADEIVVHLPEIGVLLAGDAAEWPIPTTATGPLRPWAEALRAWAARDDVQAVIPSHGPVSDSQLLLDNATYLDMLLTSPDMPWDPPAGMEFYREAHLQNAEVARRERGG
jgi:glyoxylase-like metal-dependent hydrolase (beta-lactamase superfamily II)